MTEPIRKLAAIVFTDIVGFTKLTAEDQSKASALLKQQRELFHPIVDSYKGKWVKEIGDGLLLTFDTVTDAVNCCIKLQETSKQIDDLDLRIGIHEGEILIEENDIIGDDVNIAARIEPFAAPGGIAISNKVHDAIVRESDFTTKYLGKPKLKGVGQEVKVYCITSHGLPETDLSQVSAKLEPEGFQWNVMNSLGVAASVIGLFMLINFMFLRVGYADKDETPSIAILPFENKGAEADEFYAYGISSDLISDVTGAGLIRVSSLNDIEKFEYKTLENAEIAKKLYVRYVAKGTLWKLDSIFQLSMELFDTKSSNVIYNKRWQTNWKDLAIIKDDLSENILETLKIEVLQVKQSHLTAIDPEAYEYYLKAKHKFVKRQNLEDTNIAQGLLEKAIDLDDNLIAAKRELGNIFLSLKDEDKALGKFTLALNQAENLSDKKEIGNSLRAMGNLYLEKYEEEKALEYFERSLTVFEEIGDKAGIGFALNNIGNANWSNDDTDRALEFYNRSIAIAEELDDKRSISSVLNNMSIISSEKGDYDKSLGYLKQALAISEELGEKAGVVLNLQNIGFQYLLKGDIDEALKHYERALDINNALGNKHETASILTSIGLCYIDKGDYDRALECLERTLVLNDELKYDFGMMYTLCSIGIVYTHKKDFDKAVDYQERSYDLRLAMNDKHYELYSTAYLYLTYKHLDIDYDEAHIYRLIEEEDEFYFELYFVLYELLEDSVYLEKAFDKIQEMVDGLKGNAKDKFLNYPIPRKIMEEWQRGNA